MSSQDLASKRIGENLLRGWALLGDNCPDGCNVPLMRSRDKKQLVCCGCEVDFLQAIIPTPAVSESMANTTMIKTETSCDSNENDHTLSRVLDNKIVWLTKCIEESQSVTDLHQLVDLLSKINSLRKAI